VVVSFVISLNCLSRKQTKPATLPFMIKKILLGVAAFIAVVLVLVLIIAATRPADFRVERTARLAASPLALFDQVNDHRRFAFGIRL